MCLEVCVGSLIVGAGSNHQGDLISFCICGDKTFQSISKNGRWMEMSGGFNPLDSRDIERFSTSHVCRSRSSCTLRSHSSLWIAGCRSACLAVDRPPTLSRLPTSSHHCGEGLLHVSTWCHPPSKLIVRTETIHQFFGVSLDLFHPHQRPTQWVAFGQRELRHFDVCDRGFLEGDLRRTYSCHTPWT